MEHVVFFPAPDGAPAFRRVPSLDEAVRLVEHLRNVEGVDQVSCHALTEVPLSFRPYYRVELDGAAAEAAPAQQAQPVPQVEPVEQVVPVTPQPADDLPEPVAVQADSNGHLATTGGGAKSLGFFA